MKTLPGYGRINWAIYSPDGRHLHTVATNKGTFSIRHKSAHSILIETDDDASNDSTDELVLDGWAFYDGDTPCAGKKRHLLYVRPGFTLRVMGHAPDPQRTALRLRFGNRAHEFEKHLGERELVELPRPLQAAALASAGLRRTSAPPPMRIGPFGITEWNADAEDSLIYNQITGYWHTPPDSSSNLDDGFYWSDDSACWQGAAIAEDGSFPQTALKLFFALLKPWQRREIARRMQADTFDCGLYPSYRAGDGIEFLDDHRTIEFLRNPDVALDERIQQVMDDATRYLCTLRPKKTRKETADVLRCIQEVEVGLARYQRRSGKLQGYELIGAGGTLTIGGFNDGTRLCRLLGLGRMTTRRLETLQRRWATIAPKLTWEALDLKVLAADFGIAPYVSREWLADSLRKVRDEARLAIAQQLERQREREAEALRRAAILGARRDEDLFSLAPANSSGPFQTESYFTLEVRRKSKVVETFTVCREGTRLFCGKTGLEISQPHTRREIRERLAAIVATRAATDRTWLESHNFQWLFREIGVDPLPVAA